MGLKDEIQTTIIGNDYNSFEKMIEGALRVEAHLKERGTEVRDRNQNNNHRKDKEKK